MIDRIKTVCKISTQHTAHSTQHTAHSTQHTAHSYNCVKIAVRPILLSSLLALSISPALANNPTTKLPVATDDNYGCKALLCFAGGQGVKECIPTIKRVLRDLAKGRGFPVCFGSGVQVKTAVRSEIHRTESPDFVCPDNKTPPIFSSQRKNDDYWRHICRKISVDVPESIASDKEHVHQTYYFYQ